MVTSLHANSTLSTAGCDLESGPEALAAAGAESPALRFPFQRLLASIQQLEAVLPCRSVFITIVLGH